FRFNNAFQGRDGNGASGVFAWINKLYYVNKANINPNTGHYEWHADVCTSGSGNTSPGSGYQATLSENAILTNSKSFAAVERGSYGQRILAHHQVQQSLGFG